MIITKEDLYNRFTCHDLTDEAQARCAAVRGECLSLAAFLADRLPDSREARTAVTKLEEAMFWALASIARDPHAQRSIMSLDTMRG